MNSKLRLLSTIPILLVCTLAVHIILPEANATVAATKYNILAVEYSEGCETMLINHVKTSCPTLDKIIKYDTSNQKISGQFIKEKSGMMRAKPQIGNHYMFYTNMTVCVECSLNNLSGPDIIKTL